MRKSLFGNSIPVFRSMVFWSIVISVAFGFLYVLLTLTYYPESDNVGMLIVPFLNGMVVLVCMAIISIYSAISCMVSQAVIKKECLTNLLVRLLCIVPLVVMSVVVSVIVIIVSSMIVYPIFGFLRDSGIV